VMSACAGLARSLAHRRWRAVITGSAISIAVVSWSFVALTLPLAVVHVLARRWRGTAVPERHECAYGALRPFVRDPRPFVRRGPAKAKHSAWGLAYHEVARLGLESVIARERGRARPTDLMRQTHAGIGSEHSAGTSTRETGEGVAGKRQGEVDSKVDR
jgi:hypothetical protein